MPIFIPVQVMQRPIRSMSLMKVAEFPCSGRKLQVADELELQNPRQDELCTLVIFLGACHLPISLGSLLLLPPLSATLRPCGCDYSYGPRVESQAAAYYTLSSNSRRMTNTFESIKKLYTNNGYKFTLGETASNHNHLKSMIFNSICIQFKINSDFKFSEWTPWSLARAESALRAGRLLHRAPSGWR